MPWEGLCAEISLLSSLAQVHVAILGSRLQLEKTFESVIPNTRNSHICKVSGECLH